MGAPTTTRLVSLSVPAGSNLLTSLPNTKQDDRRKEMQLLTGQHDALSRREVALSLRVPLRWRAAQGKAQAIGRNPAVNMQTSGAYLRSK